MSTTVKSLEVTHNPINESDTFTNGDVVTGQVTLEVVKECQIESLYIKFKGKSEVLWTERHGQTTVVYHSKDKYFSMKHYFIRDVKQKAENEETFPLCQNLQNYSNVVAPGCHVYPFTFQVPLKEMPSSFKGSVGKIVYLLEAKLSRSMRLSKKNSVKLNFASKMNFSNIPDIMEPQHESKDKKMKFFNSGTVAMDVSLEKTGFRQGEGISVLAHIDNNSTRDIKPKYCVYRKHSFFVDTKRKVDTKDLFKEVGEPIPPSTSTKVSRVIMIPHDMEPSIHNCSNIKVEHRLRVYLDVKYAADPEIKFPIIILPASEVSALEASDAAAAAAGGFGSEAFGGPCPETFGAAAPQPATDQYAEAPPPYASCQMYPPVNDFSYKS